MSKIRVLEIISGFAVEGPLGGLERFGIELSRALGRDACEPVVCGLWRYGTPYEDRWITLLRDEGIEAFYGADWDEAHPYQSFYRAWCGIRRHLDGQQVDLIHSHSQFGDGIALLEAQRLRARKILRTVHNEREWPRRPGRRVFLTNLVFPLRFDLEVGVSQQIVANLDARPVSRLLVRRSQCIYNAIDLDRFGATPEPSLKAAKRQELGLPLDGPLVGSVGRLTQQKGYEVLIEAAAQVVALLPATRFVIVGDGELAAQLEEQAAALGVQDAVVFAGRRGDVEDLLSVMDLFVSSSLWEGLPTVILESMASRLPVVATNVSGTRELIQDGVSGWLVPPGDALSLAEAIVAALEDGHARQVRAHRAYERVQDFTISRVAARYLDLFRRVLET